MLNKFLSFFGFRNSTYTLTMMGAPKLTGIIAWKIKGGLVVAKTKGGKTIVFAPSPFIEIQGGGIRRIVKAESVQMEETF